MLALCQSRVSLLMLAFDADQLDAVAWHALANCGPGQRSCTIYRSHSGVSGISIPILKPEDLADRAHLWFKVVHDFRYDGGGDAVRH